MTRYRVVSKHRVCGHEPGVEFEADLSEVQAARLIAGRHLEPVSDGPEAEPEVEAEPEE